MLILLAGVVGALHVGKLPPALPAIRDALGLSLLASGVLLSLVQSGGMLLGLAIGVATESLGLRRSLLIGLSTLTLTSVLGGFASTPAPLMLLRALEGFGFMMVVVPGPSLLRRLLPAQRLPGRLGLWSAYMPTGTALAMLAGAWAITWMRWNTWWWLVGGVTALMTLAIWRVIPADPAPAARGAHATPNSPATPGAQSSWTSRLRETLSHRGPWLIALTFCMYAGQWAAVIGFLPSIYAEAGIQGLTAGLLTAIVSASNIIGNLAAGKLLQRGWAALTLCAMALGSMAVGALVAFGAIRLGTLTEASGSLAWLGNPPSAVRYAGVLLFSTVGGLIPGAMFALCVRLAPGPATVATTVGLMMQWSAIGQFVSPPVVAWWVGVAGGWHATGWFCALSGLVGVAIATRFDGAIKAAARQQPGAL